MSEDLYEFVTRLWDFHPIIVILFAGGFVLFLLSIINTFRHRRQLKKKHNPRRFH